MSIEKKEYIFSKNYEKQLTSILQGKSIAFNISSFKERRLIKTKTGETGELTVRRMKVTVSDSLLPGYCNPELVEQAFTSLEKNPSNTELLSVLGEYVKGNMTLEWNWLWMTIVGVSLVTLVGVGSIFVLFTFFAILDLVTIGTLLPGAVAIISNSFLSTVASGLGLKLGLWIRNSINREPDNLRELEAKLIALIGNCITKEKIGGVTFNQILTLQDDYNRVPQAYDVHPSAPLYPSLNNSPDLITAHQNLANNTQDSISESPSAFYRI